MNPNLTSILCKLMTAVVITSATTGCGNGHDGQDGMNGSSCTVTDNDKGSATVVCTDGTSATVGGPDCSVPPSTLIMHYEWGKAEMFRRACWNEAAFNNHLCIENGKTYEECAVARNKEESHCMHIWRGWLNKIPIRECGAKIFKITGTPDDPNYSFEVDLDDSDKDGISNWDEYQMGLNPCTPNSYGSCIKDADLDFDADGIPNGKDQYPLCNMNDPAGWQTDCI